MLQVFSFFNRNPETLCNWPQKKLNRNTQKHYITHFILYVQYTFYYNLSNIILSRNVSYNFIVIYFFCFVINRHGIGVYMYIKRSKLIFAEKKEMATVAFRILYYFIFQSRAGRYDVSHRFLEFNNNRV